MMRSLLFPSLLSLAAILTAGVNGFATVSLTPSLRVCTHLAIASSSMSPESQSSDFSASSSTSTTTSISTVAPTSSQKKKDPVMMSQALPFLKTPSVLADCDYAGNMGFDPFGFASSKEVLSQFREAEIKHARVAMLAAAGWPLSELWDRHVAEFFGMPPILDFTDRVPSVLNGGLEKISPVWWGFCLGLAGAIDVYGVALSRRGNPEYFPGNFGYDPLGLYPSDKAGQERMQLAEIKHGRLAMIAVAGFAMQEYVTKLGVVDETPFFFEPITQSLS